MVVTFRGNESDRSMFIAAAATRADIPLLRCGKKFKFFCDLHIFLSEVIGLESASGVDLLLKLFDEPFKSIHLLHDGHRLARVLELEVNRWTMLRFEILLRLLNVKMCLVFSSSLTKGDVEATDDWLLQEPPYEICVPTPPVSFYISVILNEGHAW